MKMFVRFNYHFFIIIGRLHAVFLALSALILGIAVVIRHLEKMPFGESLYFSFITGLTIGYGDIVPQTPGGRLVALLIGFVGILFTGLMVAVLVFAVRESLEEVRNRS